MKNIAPLRVLDRHGCRVYVNRTAMTRNTGTLRVATPSEREITLTRVFYAPRKLVFDALTQPQIFQRWGAGPPGWSFAVCEMDLKVGGAWRFVMRSPDGSDIGRRGVYREIVSPERIVSTESCDNGWYRGEAIATTFLVEQGGKTTLTCWILFNSKESRDTVLRSPMEHGVAAGYDRLAEVLASEQAEGKESMRGLADTHRSRRILRSMGAMIAALVRDHHFSPRHRRYARGSLLPNASFGN
jgi:uncharacterized protein YndB with AHSA1/START domain